MTTLAKPAKASGEFSIGGKLPVTRLGYGTMRLTGPGAAAGITLSEQEYAALEAAVR
jgi:hypothetical protein